MRLRPLQKAAYFFVFFVFKSGFPGLLVSAEPRKMRATTQKLGRVLRHILFCALAGGFRAHPSLKITCTDFGWGGVQGTLERPSGRGLVHSAAQPLASMFV